MVYLDLLPQKEMKKQLSPFKEKNEKETIIIWTNLKYFKFDYPTQITGLFFFMLLNFHP